MAYDSISYRREIDSYSLDIGDGNDHGHGMVFGLIHPPSIFTLFASPVEVLRRRRRLSLRMLFVFLYSWFHFIIFERLFYQHVVSLYSWFDSSSSRDCFINMSYHFILGLIHHLREIVSLMY
jgi:cellulose synthase/poly-beta-1,6-N-acetylglucosamine synthase-like glycosyltransferase